MSRPERGSFQSIFVPTSLSPRLRHHHLLLDIFSSDPVPGPSSGNLPLPCVLCQGSLAPRLLLQLSPCCFCPLVPLMRCSLAHGAGGDRAEPSYPPTPRDHPQLTGRPSLASFLHQSTAQRMTSIPAPAFRRWRSGGGLGRAICPNLLRCPPASHCCRICLLREGDQARGFGRLPQGLSDRGSSGFRDQVWNPRATPGLGPQSRTCSFLAALLLVSGSKMPMSLGVTDVIPAPHHVSS